MLYLTIALICFIVGSVFGYIYRDLKDLIKSLQHNNEAKPAQIIRSNPAKTLNDIEDNGGTVVITAKTPQQIEKEQEDEINRLVSM